MGRKVIGSGKYSKATKVGAAIRTSRGTVAKARHFHRDDLRRWVENDKAIEGQTITDPRNIVPYRGACYGTTVLALQSKLKPAEVKGLKGEFSQEFSSIKNWEGNKNPETKSVATTPWILDLRLFAIACRITPDLKKRLLNRKSTRPGVKAANRVKDPFVKFLKNIEVLQRTGGVTPCAKPLMDSQMAIDHRWVISNGEPHTEYRLAIGRSTPQKQDKRTLSDE